MLIWMHPFLKLFTSNILTFKSQLHSSPWLWSMFLPVAENGSLCPQQESWVMRFGNHLLHIPSLKNLSPAQCLQTVVLCMLFNCYGCLWSSGLPWLLRWWRIHLQCRRPGSILGGLGGGGRSPGEGNGYPLQYSCLGNPIDREAWLAIVYGVAKNRTWLND